MKVKLALFSCLLHGGGANSNSNIVMGYWCFFFIVACSCVYNNILVGYTLNVNKDLLYK